MRGRTEAGAPHAAAAAGGGAGRLRSAHSPALTLSFPGAADHNVHVLPIRVKLRKDSDATQCTKSKTGINLSDIAMPYNASEPLIHVRLRKDRCAQVHDIEK